MEGGHLSGTRVTSVFLCWLWLTNGCYIVGDSHWAQICWAPISTSTCVSGCWLLVTSPLSGLIIQASVALLFTCSGCLFPFSCLLKMKNPSFCQNFCITGVIWCFHSRCRWLFTEIGGISKNPTCYSHWLFLSIAQCKMLWNASLLLYLLSPLFVTDSQMAFLSSRHFSLKCTRPSCVRVACVSLIQLLVYL